MTRGQTIRSGAPLFDSNRSTKPLHSASTTATRRRARSTGRHRDRQATARNQCRSRAIGASTSQCAQGGAATDARRSAVRRGRHPEGAARRFRANADATAAQVRELTRQVQVARLPGRSSRSRRRPPGCSGPGSTRAGAMETRPEARHGASRRLVYDTLYRAGEWVPAGSPVVACCRRGNVKVRLLRARGASWAHSRPARS